MSGIAASLLTPISWIYSGFGTLRNWGFDIGLFRTYESTLPVICVGNAVLGGSGKSPVVQFITTKLQQMGVRPVILSRGYRGRLRGPHLVRTDDLASDVGDEPLMHFRFLNDQVPVVIARDRVLGAQFIAQQALGDVIVLDDGFQHRRLKRDLNLLLIDNSTAQALEEFTQGKVLPSGPLRERKSEALSRADALVFVRRGPLQPNYVVPTLNPKEMPPSISVTIYPDSLVDLVTKERLELDALQGEKVVALTAIAKPDSFFRALRSLGVELISTLSKRDHSGFSSAELVKYENETVVVTAKDAVKLDRLRTTPGKTFVLMQQTSCDSPSCNRLLDELLQQCAFRKSKSKEMRRYAAGTIQ